MFAFLIVFVIILACAAVKVSAEMSEVERIMQKNNDRAAMAIIVSREIITNATINQGYKNG